VIHVEVQHMKSGCYAKLKILQLFFSQISAISDYVLSIYGRFKFYR